MPVAFISRSTGVLAVLVFLGLVAWNAARSSHALSARGGGTVSPFHDSKDSVLLRTMMRRIDSLNQEVSYLTQRVAGNKTGGDGAELAEQASTPFTVVPPPSGFGSAGVPSARAPSNPPAGRTGKGPRDGREGLHLLRAVTRALEASTIDYSLYQRALLSYCIGSPVRSAPASATTSGAESVAGRETGAAGESSSLSAWPGHTIDLLVHGRRQAALERALLQVSRDHLSGYAAAGLAVSSSNIDTATSTTATAATAASTLSSATSATTRVTFRGSGVAIDDAAAIIVHYYDMQFDKGARKAGEAGDADRWFIPHRNPRTKLHGKPQGHSPVEANDMVEDEVAEETGRAERRTWVGPKVVVRSADTRTTRTTGDPMSSAIYPAELILPTVFVDVSDGGDNGEGGEEGGGIDGKGGGNGEGEGSYGVRLRVRVPRERAMMLLWDNNENGDDSSHSLFMSSCAKAGAERGSSSGGGVGGVSDGDDAAARKAECAFSSKKRCPLRSTAGKGSGGDSSGRGVGNTIGGVEGGPCDCIEVITCGGGKAASCKDDGSYPGKGWCYVRSSSDCPGASASACTPLYWKQCASERNVDAFLPGDTKPLIRTPPPSSPLILAFASSSSAQQQQLHQQSQQPHGRPPQLDNTKVCAAGDASYLDRSQRIMGSWRTFSDAIGLDYWLEYGSALGQEMWGGQIPYDHDVDISVRWGDSGKIAAAAADELLLKKLGVKKIVVQPGWRMPWQNRSCVQMVFIMCVYYRERERDQCIDGVLTRVLTPTLSCPYTIRTSLPPQVPPGKGRRFRGASCPLLPVVRPGRGRGQVRLCRYLGLTHT